MIRLTRLNGKQFILNCELIKSIEATPDTVISLTHGEKLMVLESVDTVVNATIIFRQKLNQAPGAYLISGPAQNNSVSNVLEMPTPDKPLGPQ